MWDEGDKSTAFDGEWKKAKMSEADYTKAYADADERYAKMLSLLLAQAKSSKPGPGRTRRTPASPPRVKLTVALGLLRVEPSTLPPGAFPIRFLPLTRTFPLERLFAAGWSKTSLLLTSFSRRYRPSSIAFCPPHASRLSLS